MNKSQLERRVTALNKMLGRPVEPYTHDGERLRANVGCIFLEHNTHYGYKIVEISNENGGERTLTEGLTLKAATEWVTGAYWMHQTISTFPVAP